MRTVAVTLLGLLLLGLAAPVQAAEAGPEKPAVLHRIVWADATRVNPGMHIRSMERDGAGVRAVYDWPHGFTLDLSLDRTGRRVAFSPCCRTALPLLVVAPVLGGKAREPLKKGAHIDFVGGIGWSPNGKRIAFEGFSGPTESRVTTIWTVRPNGKGLRRVLDIPSPGPHEVVSNDHLAWTGNGILYSDGEDLRAARSGQSSLVMQNVHGVRISGDGRRLVLDRVKSGRRSVWMSRPDGTHRRKLFVQGEPGEGTLYLGVAPSYDASELLATRHRSGSEDQVVTWRVRRGPGSATVVELPDEHTTGATWN